MIVITPPTTLRINPPSARWGSVVERERRNRIRIAVYAYAYELRDSCLIPDSEYDQLARSINPSMETGHESLDHFFATRYSADTGLWIYEHPELARVAATYARYYVQ